MRGGGGGYKTYTHSEIKVDTLWVLIRQVPLFLTGLSLHIFTKGYESLFEY